jgi:hypothetical protein
MTNHPLSPADGRRTPRPRAAVGWRAAIAGALVGVILPAVLPALAASALAGDSPTPPSGAAAPSTDSAFAQHPGAHVAAALGIAAAVFLAVVGIGCAIAVLSTLFPRIAGAMDRQARAGSPTAPLLVGSLIFLGVLAVTAGAQHAGPAVGGLVLLVLGLPAALLSLAGSLGTVPLLGERLLSSPGASPLRRSIAASLALGLALVPSAVLHLYPLGFLVLMAILGWPLGVGVAGVLARGRAPRPQAAGAPDANPAPSSSGPAGPRADA